jgi:hypothetical protein
VCSSDLGVVPKTLDELAGVGEGEGDADIRFTGAVVWAAEVVKSCRGLNATLEAAFDAAHAEAARRYGR